VVDCLFFIKLLRSNQVQWVGDISHWLQLTLLLQFNKNKITTST